MSWSLSLQVTDELAQFFRSVWIVARGQKGRHTWPCLYYAAWKENNRKTPLPKTVLLIAYWYHGPDFPGTTPQTKLEYRYHKWMSQMIWIRFDLDHNGWSLPPRFKFKVKDSANGVHDEFVAVNWTTCVLPKWRVWSVKEGVLIICCQYVFRTKYLTTETQTFGTSFLETT